MGIIHVASLNTCQPSRLNWLNSKDLGRSGDLARQSVRGSVVDSFLVDHLVLKPHHFGQRLLLPVSVETLIS
jgi:hypothetical protein